MRFIRAEKLAYLLEEDLEQLSEIQQSLRCQPSAAATKHINETN